MCAISDAIYVDVREDRTDEYAVDELGIPTVRIDSYPNEDDPSNFAMGLRLTGWAPYYCGGCDYGYRDWEDFLLHVYAPSRFR
jgi:hypothetical protein